MEVVLDTVQALNDLLWSGLLKGQRWIHTIDIRIIPLLRTVTGATTAGNQTTLVDHCAI